MRIPHKFNPREYQIPALRALDNGIKRIFLFIHRRAGKDKTCVNILMKRAIQNAGIHYYFLPTATQARKIIWDNEDMMQHFPKDLCTFNSTEMKITVEYNGKKSIIQFIGTDKFDSIRGTNPITCIFSEYAFQDPRVWDIIRPILNENGGVAIFQTTPNGDNHASELFDLAEKNENWFTQILTIQETKRDDGSPVISEEDIKEEMAMGMPWEMVQQEYYCSRKVGALGAYYADLFNQIEDEGRIGEVPFFRDREINVHMDIGRSDNNVLIFTQRDGMNVNFINCYANVGNTDEHYTQYIKEYIKEKLGKLGTIYLPHDAKHKRTVAINSTLDNYERAFGKQKVKAVPMRTMDVPSRMIGIKKVRSLIPRFRINEQTCKMLIKAFKNYKKEFDPVKKIFRNIPLHDWSSDYMDAVRYLAMTFDENKHVPIKATDIQKQMAKLPNYSPAFR